MRNLLLQYVDYFTSDVALSNLPADEFGVNRIHINHILALVKGGAGQALDRICQNADIHRATLSLNACPLSTSVYPKPWDADKLVAWYGRRRFKLVNSKDPMFNFMGRLMVRTPWSV